MVPEIKWHRASRETVEKKEEKPGIKGVSEKFNLPFQKRDHKEVSSPEKVQGEAPKVIPEIENHASAAEDVLQALSPDSGSKGESARQKFLHLVSRKGKTEISEAEEEVSESEAKERSEKGIGILIEIIRKKIVSHGEKEALGKVSEEDGLGVVAIDPNEGEEEQVAKVKERMLAEMARRQAEKARKAGERTGEKVKRAGEVLGETARKTGEALEETGKKTGEIVGKTGELVTDKAKEAGEILGQTAKKTGEVVGETAKKAGEATTDAILQSREDRLKMEEENANKNPVQELLSSGIGKYGIKAFILEGPGGNAISAILIPGVGALYGPGDVLALVCGVAGRDLLTGEKLDPAGRAIFIASALIPGVPPTLLKEGLDIVRKGVEETAYKLVKEGDDKGALKEAAGVAKEGKDLGKVVFAGLKEASKFAAKKKKK